MRWNYMGLIVKGTILRVPPFFLWIVLKDPVRWFISCVLHLLTDLQLALVDFPDGIQINFCVSSDLSQNFQLTSSRLDIKKIFASITTTLVRVGLKSLHPSNAVCMCLSVGHCRFESCAMVNWSFGMVVWIPGIPLWNGLLLGDP